MCNEHFGSHFESSEQHKYKKILHKLLPETKIRVLKEYQSRIAQLNILEDNILKTTNSLVYTIKQFCLKSLDYLSSLQQSYMKICFLDEANEEVLKEIQAFLNSTLDITDYKQLNQVEEIEKYFSQPWTIEKKLEENLELEGIIEKEPEPKKEEKKQADENEDIICGSINEGDYSIEKGAVLMNLGCVHFKKAAYKESEEAFNKALEHYEKILDPNNSLIGAIHSNLGKVYFNLKQYEKAVGHLIKCSAIYEQTRSPDDQDLESTYEII
jgi:tetratricopeptide (TPR) repeat protein